MGFVAVFKIRESIIVVVMMMVMIAIDSRGVQGSEIVIVLRRQMIRRPEDVQDERNHNCDRNSHPHEYTPPTAKRRT
jgi:hypothetical protein